MLSFFKSKSPLVTDLSWLGVDLHSHLLPGLDDGAPDLATSLQLMGKMNELGLTKFICTPHIFEELYPNTPATVNDALKMVKTGLKKAGSAIEVAAAAEYMVDDGFTVQGEHLCLPGNYLLIEMSYLNETPNIEQVMFDLQIKGYNLILAHPERYNFYHNNVERYSRLKDMGVLFQLNLLSVTGYYGKAVQKAAKDLLDQKSYDFAGTDLHHEKHLNILETVVRNGKLFELIGAYDFKNKEVFG